MTAAEIAQLKAEVDEAQRTFNAAIARYEAACIAAVPLKRGDVIRSSKGTLAQVVRISMRWGEPRISAVLQNKDGNFGKRAAPMWRNEWDKPERVDV